MEFIEIAFNYSPWAHQLLKAGYAGEKTVFINFAYIEDARARYYFFLK